MYDLCIYIARCVRTGNGDIYLLYIGTYILYIYTYIYYVYILYTYITYIYI